MFRGFRVPCDMSITPEQAVRLALRGRFYGIELSVDPETLPEAEAVKACFRDAGITVAAVDPGLSVYASEELCRKAIDFSAEICAAAVVMPKFEEALWKYCGEKEIRMLVQVLPEEEVTGLYGIWDLSAPGAPSKAERIGHVRVSDSNMDPELLGQRLRMLRKAGFCGFIIGTEPLTEQPEEQLRQWLGKIDACDEKAALADVPLPPLYPPQGHPRVMFRSQDIPEIRQRMAAPENADALRRYREALQPVRMFLSQ